MGDDEPARQYSKYLNFPANFLLEKNGAKIKLTHVGGKQSRSGNALNTSINHLRTVTHILNDLERTVAEELGVGRLSWEAYAEKGENQCVVDPDPGDPYLIGLALLDPDQIRIRILWIHNKLASLSWVRIRKF